MTGVVSEEMEFLVGTSELITESFSYFGKSIVKNIRSLRK
jgi:hypothetical protein